MTPREYALLTLRDAGREAGLDPVIEFPEDAPPYSVDLRVMDGGRVVAAIRVRMERGQWRYEIPARPGGVELHSYRTRWLADVDQPVTAQQLRGLDYYFSRAGVPGRSGTPRPPRSEHDTPGWMIPGSRYWEKRLGKSIGRPLVRAR